MLRRFATKQNQPLPRNPHLIYYKKVSPVWLLEAASQS